MASFVIEDGMENLYINNSFFDSPLNKVYVGRNLDYPEGRSPFSLLSALSRLTIGKTVTKVGDGQYLGNENLTDVTSYAEVAPSAGENIFSESNYGAATLHVSAASCKSYRETYPWYRFRNLSLMDEGGEETITAFVIGDAPGDGDVNTADVEEVKDYIMGHPSDTFNFGNADVNGDGQVNAVDVTKLVNIIMGKE